ncbi:MAG: ribosomal RNA small subunit methyltransferase A, partial [Desulfobacterales bacterium]|nr:ribosomal RNA small subunit methyltransferase A [Desulfobacterales bacterium]
MTSPYILLKDSKVYPKKQLGQNFLADPSTAATIISRSNISSDDVVLEIGSGLGALTIPSAGISKKVYAIEKDRHIIPLLEKELALNGIENVTIIKDNILNIDINALAEKEGVKMTVIGNLPYNISSQILIRLIAARNNINSAVLMFQKELGQRIAAGPGGKQYGRVSVMLQYCADIKSLYQIKARLFYPRP